MGGSCWDAPETETLFAEAAEDGLKPAGGTTGTRITCLD